MELTIDPKNPTIILIDGEPVAETGLRGDGEDGGAEQNAALARWLVDAGNFVHKD